MRTIQLQVHFSSKQLKEKLHKEKDVRLFRYWQLLYIISINPGKKDSDYAEMVAMVRIMYTALYNYITKRVSILQITYNGAAAENKPVIYP